MGNTTSVASRLDCARSGRPRGRDLCVNRPYITCASPEYIRAHGAPTHPSDLEDPRHRVLSLFMPGTNKPRPMAFERDGERLTVEGRSTLSLNESNAYVASGLAGLGVMCVCSYLVKDALLEGRMVRLMPDWACDDKPIYIAHASRRHMSARLRVFIDWTVQLFEHEPLFRPRAAIPGSPVPASAAAKPRTTARRTA